MAYSKARRLSDLVSSTGEVSAFTDASIVPADLNATLDLTGKTITVATASASDNDTTVASTAFVQQELASLVDSAPGTLNTLNELAAALGDDASFSTTVTNSIATKLPLAGGTMTGALNMGSQNITGANRLTLADGITDTGQAGSSTVFNESGSTADFRIESDSNTHMFFLDAGQNSIGINQSQPSSTYALDVGGQIRSTGNSPAFNLREDDSSNQHYQLGSYAGVFAVRDVTGSAYPLQISTTSVKISKDTSINRGNETSGELLIGGTTDGGFVDFDGTNLQLNTQRDPNTGTFINTGKSNARIEISGPSGGSHIAFRTASANNTSAAERMRIDKDGNLTLGDDQHLYLGDATSDLDIYHIGGSVSVLRSTPALVVQSDDYISLGTYSGGELMLKATKNGSTDLYYDNAVKIKTTSTGIAFNGDTSAANSLDDYEEGTWTPDLRNGTTSWSTQTWQYGPTATYTKIGRMVYIHMSGKLSSVGGNSTGEMRVFGLPFTPHSTGGYQEYRVNFVLGNQPNTGDSDLFGFIRNSGNDIGTRILDGGDTVFVSNRIDSDTFMSFWGAYFTDS